MLEKFVFLCNGRKARRADSIVEMTVANRMKPQRGDISETLSDEHRNNATLSGFNIYLSWHYYNNCIPSGFAPRRFVEKTEEFCKNSLKAGVQTKIMDMDSFLTEGFSQRDAFGKGELGYECCILMSQTINF